ncbi:MAG: thioredoxin family protein [Deltaproteobacteria bacterium]|nr:MAG: thioredoxin family protein [Deltaproteobacteria bacterium]
MRGTSVGIVLCAVVACRSTGTEHASAPTRSLATGSAAPAGAAASSVRKPDALVWTPDEVAAFTRARGQRKGVVIEFYAAWCAPCLELDRWLATRDAFEVIAPSFVALRFDVTEESTEAAERRWRYGANTLPALVFVDTGGQVLERVSEMREATELLDIARAASVKLRNR